MLPIATPPNALVYGTGYIQQKICLKQVCNEYFRYYRCFYACFNLIINMLSASKTILNLLFLILLVFISEEEKVEEQTAVVQPPVIVD